LLYHWIIAVFGIAALLYGWVWVQERANRDPCEGVTDEALCGRGAGCQGCMRTTDATLNDGSVEDTTAFFQSRDRRKRRS